MIKIAVCEDEPLAMDALADKINAYMGDKRLEYRASRFSSGEALLFGLDGRANCYDIIFLDIKMNRIDGMATARAIRETDSRTAIVFVTALKEYVFDSFDVDAANFLVKPIADEKLFSTLDKILAQRASCTQQSLVIRTAKESQSVPFASIVYCEVLNHRIFVYEIDRMHEYSGKIDELEHQLDDDFFRCHRSYLVNFRFVQHYRDGFAHMTSAEKIPVATRRRQEFMKALLRFQRKEVR